MTVYIEEVLLSNFIITLVILLLTSKIVHTSNKTRLILGSFFGAVSSTIYPLINYVPLEFIFKVFIALIIIAVSFKFKTKRHYLLCLNTFLILTGVFGGIMLAINYYFKITFLPLPFTSLIILFFSYILSIWFSKIFKKEKLNEYCFNTKLILNSVEINTKAFLDTGNTLVDPITNSPIVVVNISILKKLYAKINYVDILLGKINCIKGAHYIEISTAYKGGKMLVFEIDKLCVDLKTDIKEIEKVCCGLSFSNFSALNCEILLNPILL